MAGGQTNIPCLVDPPSLLFEIDLAADGITVLSQSPGWVRTDMGGENAKFSVEESVANMLRHLENVGPEANGKFLGEEGEAIPW